MRVVIGEQNAFAADAVDLRRGHPHHAVVVESHIPDPDIVGHDDEDVRALRFGVDSSEGEQDPEGGEA